MKTYALIILCTLSSCLIIAQDKIYGTILNTKKEAVPFASIGYYNHRMGGISDKRGNFTIEKVLGDSLKISSIGFKPKIILVDNITHDMEIILEEDVEHLGEVIVKTRSKTTNKAILGHYHSKNNFYNLLALNLQEAVFIPNPNNLRGYIDNIKFKLADFKGKGFMLRIRLYNIDSKTNMPSQDLLVGDNIIFSKQLKRVNILSIKSKNIELPKQGVFVSFEWLPENMANIDKKVPYILGNLFADKNYRYQNFKEIRWNPLLSSTLSGDGYFQVPNIAIVISY